MLTSHTLLGHAAPGARADRADGSAAPPAASAAKVTASGKFFELQGRKWYLKGLTYGPFAPNASGLFLPEPEQIRADFLQIRLLGANCIRLYHRPPAWVLDLAMENDLRVFVDVPWEKHRCFFEDYAAQQRAREEVRRTARELGGHPGLFAISVANEFPSDVVRFHGRSRVAGFVDDLIDTVKQEAPDCLATFANYPSTEFLRPGTGDFVCFNVYLESQRTLSAYLDRLQHLAGARPLILGEFGVDSFTHGESGQSEALDQHVRTVFQHGLAGSFVFSFTDDWFTGGHQIENWAFGIVRRDRTEKPAAAALRNAWTMAPRISPGPAAKASVVVCSYNGGKTLRECLHSLTQLNYPDYEVILVDDGSTDDTPAIAADFANAPMANGQSAVGSFLYVRQENRGLSVARNVGAEASRGEIVVYTDSDCVADPDWLYYLIDAMQRQGVKAIGGPNLPPSSDSWTARCVAASPGGPSHVMLDDQHAEHVPGCNMAFDRATLLGIGGFDPQFRQAGDDVDICWRLLDANIKIGYAAAALVWHHRRSTAGDFLKQQRGYGRSEAMLLRKWHRKFNLLGCSLWRGIIYGEGAVGLSITEPAVFYGRFGSGLFQTIYHRQDYRLWAYFTLLEWHLGALLLVGLSPLLPAMGVVATAMWVLTLAAGVRSTAQSPLPRNAPAYCWPLVFALHLLQPIVRSAARYWHRLSSGNLPAAVLADEAPRIPLKRIRFDTRDAYWSSQCGRGREHLLDALQASAARTGWSGVFNEEWEAWDVRLHGDWWYSLSIWTATEELGGDKRFTRVRCQADSTPFGRVVGWTLVAVSLAAIVSGHTVALLGGSLVATVLCLRRWLSRRRCFAALSALLADAARAAGLEPVAPMTVPDAPAQGVDGAGVDGAGVDGARVDVAGVDFAGVDEDDLSPLVSQN